jgi:hypothetical protein
MDWECAIPEKTPKFINDVLFPHDDFIEKTEFSQIERSLRAPKNFTEAAEIAFETIGLLVIAIDDENKSWVGKMQKW